MRLSVVIPTLNEAAALRANLDALTPLRRFAEIVIADGGSTDATVALAECAGCTVVRAPRGRGSQLDEGARVASGDVLWFLHADTVAAQDAGEQIARACADERVVAGNFRLIFDGSESGAKFLTALYPHLRWLGCDPVWLGRLYYREHGARAEFQFRLSPEARLHVVSSAFVLRAFSTIAAQANTKPPSIYHLTP
ncbi:MAG: glycosyltransferase, partial [Verrucomicrobia bacterium]|nr:glycosyltransferase [Verrucomicrobiota bacterium]